MAETSLKQKALNGVIWQTINTIVVRVLSFITGIIIARILSPSDYGLLGMLAIFFSLADTLINSGISQALVQKIDRTQTDYSTAFFFNISIGAFCYAILFFSAPFIADFYDNEKLTNILRVSSIGLIINSLCPVQIARLLIKIDFRTVAIINLISFFICGAIGIWMAYNGYGVWALIFQTLSQQMVSTMLLWLFGKWWPTLEFSIQSCKKLFGFGSKLLITGIIGAITKEISTIMIGKFYKAESLGYYTRAVQTTGILSQTTATVINSTTFPILSSIQNEQERMLYVYKRMLSMTAFCVFPVMTILAILSCPFISVVLTDKWLPAAPYMQWLCFAEILMSIGGLIINILNACGRPDLFMKANIWIALVRLLCVIVALPFGVLAIVVANFVSSVISYFIYAYFPKKLFGFGLIDQLKMFYKTIICTCIMSIITLLVIYFIDSNILKLIIGLIVALASYYVLALMMKMPDVYEINNIVCNFLRKKISK